MTKGRLEAYSDGVLAILITIMVLELRVPHGTSLESLRPLAPEFVTYLLSFVYLGIYWNNHHHLLHAADRIDGRVLWANQHLLFWLSLVPFVTGWMGENHFAPLPTSLYGVVLLLAAVSFTILQKTLIAAQGPGSRLLAAIGSDRKGKISILIYLLAIPLAFLNEWFTWTAYVIVAVIWFVPDRRFESALRD